MAMEGGRGREEGGERGWEGDKREVEESKGKRRG